MVTRLRAAVSILPAGQAIGQTARHARACVTHLRAALGAAPARRASDLAAALATHVVGAGPRAALASAATRRAVRRAPATHVVRAGASTTILWTAARLPLGLARRRRATLVFAHAAAAARAEVAQGTRAEAGGDALPALTLSGATLRGRAAAAIRAATRIRPAVAGARASAATTVRPHLRVRGARSERTAEQHPRERKRLHVTSACSSCEIAAQAAAARSSPRTAAGRRRCPSGCGGCPAGPGCPRRTRPPSR